MGKLHCVSGSVDQCAYPPVLKATDAHCQSLAQPSWNIVTIKACARRLYNMTGGRLQRRQGKQTIIWSNVSIISAKEVIPCNVYLLTLYACHYSTYQLYFKETYYPQNPLNFEHLLLRQFDTAWYVWLKPCTNILCVKCWTIWIDNPTCEFTL